MIAPFSFWLADSDQFITASIVNKVILFCNVAVLLQSVTLVKPLVLDTHNAGDFSIHVGLPAASAKRSRAVAKYFGSSSKPI
jgi:hypothetical protein